MASFSNILVPKGAEYQAVCRGLPQNLTNTPKILPIPMGYKAVSRYLNQWLQSPEILNNPPTGVLLMGLGGSLSPLYSVGDIVIYQGCGNILGQWYECEQFLINKLMNQLQARASVVRGLTSDRLLWMSQEKRDLGNRHNMDVVDMEGLAVIKLLSQVNIPLGIVRVISDDCYQDLPDLTSALTSEGELHPLSLALGMLKNPLRASKLVISSLKSLQGLENLTCEIFSVLN